MRFHALLAAALLLALPITAQSPATAPVWQLQSSGTTAGLRGIDSVNGTVAWITVGTNGSDISRDDGRTWHPFDNGNWNALSLPFVVGPHGRIAKLNPSAISPPSR